MARESAHQLGTPLMSLTGWIGYLREHPDTPGRELISHLEADAERLERVAKRFERIGRQGGEGARGAGRCRGADRCLLPPPASNPRESRDARSRRLGGGTDGDG